MIVAQIGVIDTPEARLIKHHFVEIKAFGRLVGVPMLVIHQILFYIVCDLLFRAFKTEGKREACKCGNSQEILVNVPAQPPAPRHTLQLTVMITVRNTFYCINFVWTICVC